MLAAMIDRRRALFLGVLALVPRAANATAMSSRVTAYAFTFKGLDGGEILLSAYAGHPILIVNTASLCGYTPQYAGLEELWTRYHGRGLMILAVPSNDFGGQEPGGASEIHATAQGQYHVTFPLTEKVAVKGAAAHPFYRWAAQEAPVRGAALEFPQVSDRPRRPPEGGVYLRRRANRPESDRGDRKRACRRVAGRLFAAKSRQESCCRRDTFAALVTKPLGFALTNRRRRCRIASLTFAHAGGGVRHLRP